MLTHSWLHKFSLLFCIAILIFLNGCTTFEPVSSETKSMKASLIGLPSNMSVQLNSAAVGTEFVTEQSPWGSRVSILVLDAYFAASGLNCKKLQINETNQIRTVCRTEQQWFLNPEILEAIQP